MPTVLARFGIWPADMPPTHDLAALGLPPTDDKGASTKDRDREERRRKRRIIELDGQEFSAEELDLGRLVAYISENPGSGVLKASLRKSRLAVMPEVPPKPSGTSQSTSNRRKNRLSDEQKTATGLVGELAAFAWLERAYSDVFSPDCWVSSYREIAGHPPGNDDLGYDFAVPLKSQIIFFEVKSTRGDEMQFELTEAEAGNARDCARTSRADYRVLWVPHVLDTEWRSLHVLPNPMDPAARHLYRFPGTGLLCKFQTGI
jgi:hypothetical protein